MREEGDTPFININESSPMLDTLMYPLIHLHGEDSWTEVVVVRRRGSRPRRQADTGTRCSTIRQYYSARLMVHRDMLGGHEVLMRCRGLFQQWLCDAAVKIMDANLRYAETHQDELQVCMYDSLRRFVTSEAERLGRHPGRIVILPPNEQKSERHQYANYIDAVCIASKYGAPDLFMTMTSNPRWPEVVECAASRGLAEHEFLHMPDVLVRAYLGRCNALIHDVINKSVFGQVLAYVGVHEFTSTMLPHFHLAVIPNKIDRPDGPETLDTLMCAEIPSAERAPELHKKVMAVMLHRPCDGTSKGYNNPRCRADMVECAGIVSQNHLLKKVEPQRLYLFGYMEKESTGHHVQGSMFSYARRQEEQTGVLDWDEIQHCRDMRLVGPYEAYFRIFGLPFARLSHAVGSLSIYLPDRQYVYYRGDAVVASRRMPNSKLLAWFRLNAATVCARDLLYAEVVTRYKWEKGSWLPKGPKNCLGRLMHVNPSPRNMELYYLRLILLNVRGATSWDDLLTVDGRRFDTFKEASLALGIRSGEEGKDYDTAMAEVVTHGSPWQLRRFFATLIAAFDLHNTTELRDLINAREEIVDLVINADNAFDRTALERMLTIEEEDVSDAEEDDDNMPHSSVEAMSVPPPTCHLTDEQQVIFNAIMEAVRLPDHQVLNHRGFAVIAPAGCGKTLLFNKLLQTCKDEGMPAIACALTAIAALLFLDEAEKLRKAKLILIDEVSMLSAEQALPYKNILYRNQSDIRTVRHDIPDLAENTTENVSNQQDELLRMVMGKPDLLFGGKCVVLGGDMAQVLPVIRGLSPRAVAEHTVRAWGHWPQLQKFSLTKNMRALRNPEFSAWLEKSMLVAVPNVDRSDMRSPETRLTEATVQRVFGDLAEERCGCSVSVSPTNDAVIDVNQFILEVALGQAATQGEINARLARESGWSVDAVKKRRQNPSYLQKLALVREKATAPNSSSGEEELEPEPRAHEGSSQSPPRGDDQSGRPSVPVQPNPQRARSPPYLRLAPIDAPCRYIPRESICTALRALAGELSTPMAEIVQRLLDNQMSLAELDDALSDFVRSLPGQRGPKRRYRAKKAMGKGGGKKRGKKQNERAMRFKQLQEAYRSNPSHAAKMVLDEAKVPDEVPPPEEVEEFYQRLFGIPADLPEPRRRTSGTIDLFYPISRSEVKQQLSKLKDTAKGPDGITRSDLRTANVHDLVAFANIIFGSRSVPKALRGVKKGDPTSGMLFNLILDSLLVELEEEFGVPVGRGEDGGTVMVAGMGFEDDTVLLSDTPEGMQRHVRRLERWLASNAMEVNVAKCKALQYVKVPTAKRLAVVTRPMFHINETAVQCLEVGSQLQYLGLTYSERGAQQPGPRNLQVLLERLRKAALRPWQKMSILRTYLLPRLYHTLQGPKVDSKSLKFLDGLVKSFVKVVLHPPKTTPDAFLYARVKEGGLGLPLLHLQIPTVYRRRLEKGDAYVKAALTSPTMQALMSRLVRLCRTSDGDGWQCHGDGGEEASTFQATAPGQEAIRKAELGKYSAEVGSCQHRVPIRSPTAADIIQPEEDAASDLERPGARRHFGGRKVQGAP
ncbi:Retrovirus-related Pol polyprotein from type-1 retrotransposable element R2 [Frankliniella fusca]|uniref:ATP-dependent DNA helicase n=1 Tax=Frankliniella fusca TaxID=407009 RepID=A0AAE1GZ06_9NEOP|nr:Retrovirus-related Pol polyprotein from type-1 retrotransposable element R2 [Frankliniella fusca]